MTYPTLSSGYSQVPVAQMDRVSPSEGEGQAFESPRAHHFLFIAHAQKP